MLTKFAEFAKNLSGLSFGVLILAGIVLLVLALCFVNIYTLWFLFTSGNMIAFLGGVLLLLSILSNLFNSK